MRDLSIGWGVEVHEKLGIGVFHPDRKRLALEAAWELQRARILTLRPVAAYSPALGTLIETGPPAGPGTDPVTGRAEVEDIGHVVGRCPPFYALCLQQATAAGEMCPDGGKSGQTAFRPRADLQNKALDGCPRNAVPLAVERFPWRRNGDTILLLLGIGGCLGNAGLSGG